MTTTRIMIGDSRKRLAELDAESVHCIVTSPPYYGLRDYGVDGQIGLEETFDEYIGRMLEVFDGVRRVLRTDGVCWVNMGDSYAGSGKGPEGNLNKGETFRHLEHKASRAITNGLKPKDLIGQPWRLAFALQTAGWWLRSCCIWHKLNPMPESVEDRPTTAHEYVFLLTKSERYFYDAEAVREPGTRYEWNTQKFKGGDIKKHHGSSQGKEERDDEAGRNMRTVWSMPSEPFSGAHFATFPSELPRRCIAGGTSERGCCAKCGAPWRREVEIVECAGHKPRLDEARFKVGSGAHKSSVRNQIGWLPSCSCDSDTVPCVVLDPFGGAGTTSMVAAKLGRNSVMVELNPEYAAMAEKRIRAEVGTLYNKINIEQQTRNT